MKCPKCKDPTLVMSERRGIEIDYCPDCRGVWLDRGELDKMLEQSTQHQSSDRHESHHHKSSDDHRDHYKKPYRKKSFLEELFD